MSAPASLSSPTAAPTGAEAYSATPSALLLLFIIRMFILWAEGVAASLRQRTETTDLTGLMRAFGTTDTALLLARFTVGLQRLRVLEAEILAGPPNPNTDKQLASRATAASPRIPSAPEPSTPTPPAVPRPMPERRTAPPVRATGPPRPPSQSEKPPTGPNHPLPPEGHGGPRHADSPARRNPAQQPKT